MLQQECVDVESLDDVDSSGKTLLDRLTMPVIFPDGYVHCIHMNTHLRSRNPSTEALYSLFLCPIEWPNRTVENAEYRGAFCIYDLTSHSTIIQ